MASAYEKDTYAWAMDQAHRLRTGEALDVENLAEEIEDLGKRQKSYLLNNLAILLAHMLKFDYQPDQRTKSWTYTIIEHRRRINRHLKDNPSLQAVIPEILQEAYIDATLKAAAQTGMDRDRFPDECPYSWGQITQE